MSSHLHFFAIPALAPEPAQGELNQFLQQHRVVHLEKQWVADGAASFWSLCVTTLDGPGPLPAGLRAPGQGHKTGPKVDYRELLSEADFSVFATLRNLRAGLATAEGVPPYALFSNEQLATMVRQRVVSSDQLRAIDGACGTMARALPPWTRPASCGERNGRTAANCKAPGVLVGSSRTLSGSPPAVLLTLAC